MQRLKCVFIVCFFCQFGFYSVGVSQEFPSIKLAKDHNNWGWDAWVMKNDLITLATVPTIGARVMQYDLDSHSSMFVNPSELGKTYTPRSNSGWPNFGGFKNWPAPQSVWNWPPPPTLDFGNYEVSVDSSLESVSLIVTSSVEQWKAPGLRIKRKTTLYDGTTRVKVEQTLINEGEEDQEWSIWDVTQNITNHLGETDFENFWVYFPINPESIHGENGVRVSEPSSAWVGEVAEGIYGVQYLPEAKKIFADSHIGWIGYVDERDGYLYAKTFDIFEEGVYPDNGGRVEVWINSDPYYLEVEVLSPIVNLSANGGSYTFTEDWWAAKIDGGPVLSVNETGAVTKFEYLHAIGRLSGSFGVFHDAYARLEYLDSAGAIVTSTDTVKVTPLEKFMYDEPFSPIENADSVRMVLVDADLNQIGVLISESIQVLLTSNEEITETPKEFQLNQNYPNPFNPSTNISYSIPKASQVKIEVFNMLGKSVGLIENSFKTSGNHTAVFDGSNLSSGIYLYRIEAGELVQTRRMVLIK